MFSIAIRRVEALKGLPTLISDAAAIRDLFTVPDGHVSEMPLKRPVRRILAQSHKLNAERNGSGCDIEFMRIADSCHLLIPRRGRRPEVVEYCPFEWYVSTSLRSYISLQSSEIDCRGDLINEVAVEVEDSNFRVCLTPD